jgi:hypothetical protein
MMVDSYVQILYLDFAKPTELRSDSHIGGKDCLHYCIPGPEDNWVVWIMDAIMVNDYHHC